jgi:hypothetical protein
VVAVVVVGSQAEVVEVQVGSRKVEDNDKVESKSVCGSRMNATSSDKSTTNGVMVSKAAV